MIVACIIILVLAVGYVMLVEPAPRARDKAEPFVRRNYAHRGLHNRENGVPENSLAAFSLAAEAGYGIELDLQLTKDDKVVVFHDDDLERMCGVKGKLRDMTYAELSRLRLAGTEERIPLFKDVLTLVDGRSNLIVELKTCPRYKELCRLADEQLRKYDGLYCIESFDPRIVGWFDKHHTSVFRGQLITSYEDYRSSGKGRLMAFVLSQGLMNVIARPHFIAHSMGKKSLSVRVCLELGAVPAVWTVRTPEDARRLKGTHNIIIFENYTPDLYF